ncbi:MAG TPA: demethoxyubiquinone hydroxylase family protein, partial [Rhizomicrobium sp.]|nr:demethoxyubiquinone hydroxylase family protein [Rhizomicrobium sp.]
MRKAKPKAPGGVLETEAMIRVDHAGEYGAVRIYEGQLAILGRRASGDLIRHMAEQEQRHLKAFDRLVNERRVRPTALEPVWR